MNQGESVFVTYDGRRTRATVVEIDLEGRRAKLEIRLPGKFQTRKWFPIEQIGAAA